MCARARPKTSNEAPVSSCVSHVHAGVLIAQTFEGGGSGGGGGSPLICCMLGGAVIVAPAGAESRASSWS